MHTLDLILSESAKRHKHLCPRQVLGARMGMFAGELLGLELPQTAKRLYTIVETDGCASDGIAVATNCWVGRRTLRVEDLGKVAATFVDTHTGRAVRVVPRPQARLQARALTPEARNTWEAQLLGYQRLPTEQLLRAQAVTLKTPIEDIISRPGHRVQCEQCGEEILNEREVMLGGRALCRTCAGQGYYTPLVASAWPGTVPVPALELAV